MAPTQAERKSETRARLLAAGAELFARRGVQGTSAEAIAEQAERTSGALYAHFGGKEGVLLALLDEWEGEVARRMAESLSGATSGRARFAVLWDQFANVPTDGSAQHDHGDTWRLLEHELLVQASRNPVLADELAGRFATARANMATAFADWHADDDADVADGEQVATLVLALLLGLEMQRRLDDTAVPDELAVRGLSLLFDT